EKFASLMFSPSPGTRNLYLYFSIKSTRVKRSRALLNKNEKTRRVMHNKGALIQIVRFCSVAVTRNKRAFIAAETECKCLVLKNVIVLQKRVQKGTLSRTFFTQNVDRG